MTDARTRRRRGRRPRLRRPSGVLDTLSPVESAAVLRTLLERHPGLETEAEQVAAGLVGEISAEELAGYLRTSLLLLGYDDLNARSGVCSGTYLDATDAAWELLGEVVDPEIQDMKHRRHLGLAEAAESMCIGIVRGLYEAGAADSGDIIAWAPDFPLETAHRVIETLLDASPEEEREAVRARLLAALEHHAPGWNMSKR